MEFYKRWWFWVIIILVLLVIFFFPKWSFKESGELWSIAGNEVGQTYKCKCIGLEFEKSRCKSCDVEKYCLGIVSECSTSCFKNEAISNSSEKIEVSCNTNLKLDDEKVITSVYPKIIEYCNYLKNNSKDSGDPTCYWETQNISYYKLVSNIEPSQSPQYKYYQEDEKTIVLVNLGLIYGWNTRPGYVKVNFTISKEGKIINRNMPIKGNLYNETYPNNIIGFF